MLKTFYVQTDEVKRITDVIEFPYQDYKEIQLNTPLPYGILGGCYKLLENNEVIYIPEWDVNKLAQDVETLNTSGDVLTKSLAEVKLENIKKGNIINNLTKSLSEVKLDIIQLKGGK